MEGREVEERFNPEKHPLVRLSVSGRRVSDPMRQRLGRFLQLLGLCIVPSGIAGNVLYPQVVTEGVMLTILAAGAFVFYIGWSLQGQT